MSECMSAMLQDMRIVNDMTEDQGVDCTAFNKGVFLDKL